MAPQVPTTVLNVNDWIFDADVEVPLNGVITGNVRIAFSRGHCHTFAYVLSEITGWEAMGVCWEDDLPGHVVCKDENGNHWDVDGCHAPWKDAENVDLQNDAWLDGYRPIEENALRVATAVVNGPAYRLLMQTGECFESEPDYDPCEACGERHPLGECEEES